MKFGETIYYCKKKEGVEKYDKPIPIVLQRNYFSLMPTSSYEDIMIYGSDVSKRYTAYANYRIWGKTFNEGDRLYVDGLKPNEQDEYGEGANAVIDGVLYDNHFVKVRIKKLVS